MVLSEIIVNESFPAPDFQASPMELSAIKLTGNGLDPFPVLVEKAMKNGSQSSPFEELPPNQQIPCDHVGHS